MRRSKQVPLTLLAAAALAAIGCHDQPRHCVDAQNRILPDSQCPADENHSGAYYGGAHYIYGGASGGRVGDAVVGGSTSRGGASFGGFGHGGGGEGGGE